ncbi:DUF302 domain-containing protein [Prolixibacteraceae bacterium JC049]|nr:DUF302 domain-containing protein [Prolixibacteraceae bacterium JC049]
MEKFWIGLLVGVVVGAGLLVLIVFINAPKKFFKTWKSPHNFEQTLQRIEQETKNAKWSIPNQYNLQKTMEKHGFEVRPVYVFSVCKPQHAYRLLSKDNERQVAAMMPCRLAVYEKSDGSTYVTMMNSPTMSKLMGGLPKEVMADAATENIAIIEKALK